MLSLAVTCFLTSTPTARAEIAAWYELVDSTGPGDGVVSVEQGAAGLPLIITTDGEPGVYTFTIRFVADIDEMDAIISYALDLIAPDDDTISATSVTYLSALDFNDDPILGSGPGTIIDDAGQLSFFGSESGLVELFEFDLEISVPPEGDIEIFSGIGAFVWATFLGTPVDIAFADSSPIDAGTPDLVSDTPSILIRQGAVAGGTDCDGNGTTDADEIDADPSLDCNANGQLDGCEIEDGTAADCNSDDVPDTCELAVGTAVDCNENGVPDACDLLADTSDDCNGNSIPDTCELKDGTATDCNANGVLDGCDIAETRSADCDANGVPDECDLDDGAALDCNANTVPDTCDVANGVSTDSNSNGVPDECEAPAEGEGTGGSETGGKVVDRGALRAFLGFIFSVPVEGGVTPASVPGRLLGVLGAPATLALTLLEWLNLPVRIFLFEMMYGFWDAILP